LRTNAAPVLALRYDWRNTSLVTLHNFSDQPQKVQFQLEGRGADLLVNVLHDDNLRARQSGSHEVELGSYGYKWLRVGAVDTALDRS
jgi:maltose alpha-D-glucosyltransferase/alpha-amylase